MGAIKQFLDGKKTYLVAVAVVIVTGLFRAHYIDAQTYEAIAGFLGALGLWTMRAAVKKSGPVVAASEPAAE